MSKLILGSISYCPGDKSKIASRIDSHQQQLAWLESMNLTDYVYYRVEQAYTPEFKKAVKTNLDNYLPIEFNTGIGPAAARNVLLRKLYGSDSDWLVCLDDDRDLYSHYGGTYFIEELNVNPALIELASKAILINGICPARRPFKKWNTDFENEMGCEKYWNLRRAQLDGCLQIACIPNLVKYGYKPIYFDETNDCMHGKPPEDIQFQLDWCLGKHNVATNMMMIVRDIHPEQCNVSTVYETQELRKEVMDTHPAAIARYLRLKTKNRFSKLTTFNDKKNPLKPLAIPRYYPYNLVQSDIGKYIGELKNKRW